MEFWGNKSLFYTRPLERTPDKMWGDKKRGPRWHSIRRVNFYYWKKGTDFA